MESLARLPLFFALDRKTRDWSREAMPPRRGRSSFCRPPARGWTCTPKNRGEEALGLAATPPRGRIVMHRREWQEADFNDAAIAIGACRGCGRGRAFSAAARAAGVPVNVIDKPGFLRISPSARLSTAPRS
jgi:uroporphyrin-III C-methyltransferase/precorrin-2 dehydrogenase/sirohydrochlorin ferrochelatase